MSHPSTVKQEKRVNNAEDSSEYDEWARKLVERPSPQIGTLQNTPGSAGIFGQQLTNEGWPPNWGFDRDSAIGKFSWITIGEDRYVPVLFRNNDLYASVRMAEVSALGDLLNLLPPELYESVKITAYYATPAEAKLLSYINSWHCDGFYGPELFTSFDLIITVEDLRKFYHFLHFAFNVLHSGGVNIDSECTHCGFIRVNSESMIPYTVLESEERGVPLFYFEGQTDVLKAKAKPLSGWPLAYLKICCKVQGVRKDLISNPTLQIVTLADLQAYFPKRTTFTDKCWPPPKSKSLLPKQVLNGAMQGPGPALLVSSDKWTKLDLNENFPNYRPSPPVAKDAPAAATISTVVMNSKNGNAPTNFTFSVNGVQKHREIPKDVQQRSPALARLKISSPPVDASTRSKLVQISEHPEGSREGAYVVRLILVESNFMHCINSKAGKHNDYLILLQQFMDRMFPDISIYPVAVSALRSQDIITYLPNSAQIRTLNNFGFQFQESWQAPLVLAQDVTNAISKLRSVMKPRQPVSVPNYPAYAVSSSRVSNGGNSYSRSYSRR